VGSIPFYGTCLADADADNDGAPREGRAACQALEACIFFSRLQIARLVFPRHVPVVGVVASTAAANRALVGGWIAECAVLAEGGKARKKRGTAEGEEELPAERGRERRRKSEE